jgi:hypothetical protein
MGFLCTFLHSVQLRKLNQSGVRVSLAYLTRFLIPGIFSGILSAILVAINQGSNGPYKSPFWRDPSSQGGMQMAGVGLSIATGIVGGLFVAFLYRSMNRNEAIDQFDDTELYRSDFPPPTRYIDWNTPS